MLCDVVRGGEQCIAVRAIAAKFAEWLGEPSVEGEMGGSEVVRRAQLDFALVCSDGTAIYNIFRFKMKMYVCVKRLNCCSLLELNSFSKSTTHPLLSLAVVSTSGKRLFTQNERNSH